MVAKIYEMMWIGSLPQDLLLSLNTPMHIHYDNEMTIIASNLSFHECMTNRSIHQSS